MADGVMKCKVTERGSILRTLNGEYHREDGPAVEWSDGESCWFRNGKLHRDKGPAVVFSYHREEWWFNGMLHREDGPAIDSEEYSEWHIRGQRLSEEQFRKDFGSKL